MTQKQQQPENSLEDLKHKDVPAKYRCTRCGQRFEVQAGSFSNPKCILCDCEYVEWLNFKEYVMQWGSAKLPKTVR